MKTQEDMTLNELMAYYLYKSQVANGGSVNAAPGGKTTVFVETVGGQDYTEQVEATAWGKLDLEPAVLLKLFGDKYYALSHETYNDICRLLNRNLDSCEVATTIDSPGARPGSRIRITPEGKSAIYAVAWYEIPPRQPLKLFKVDGEHYAISLAASKVTSQQTVSERKTGRFATPDPRREIIWHDLNLFGLGIAGFPCKPAYLS